MRIDVSKRNAAPLTRSLQNIRLKTEIHNTFFVKWFRSVVSTIFTPTNKIINFFYTYTFIYIKNCVSEKAFINERKRKRKKEREKTTKYQIFMINLERKK